MNNIIRTACLCVHMHNMSPGTCCAGQLMQIVLLGEGLLGGVDSAPTACSAPPTGQ